MWTPYVMLICLAGLRSIPPSIYEAAECDRASKWRQFWTITFPYIRGLLMLALLFRTIVVSNMGDAQPGLLLGSYFSSVFVVTNSLRLRRFSSPRETQ